MVSSAAGRRGHHRRSRRTPPEVIRRNGFCGGHWLLAARSAVSTFYAATAVPGLRFPAALFPSVSGTGGGAGDRSAGRLCFNPHARATGAQTPFGPAVNLMMGIGCFDLVQHRRGAEVAV